VAVYNPRRFLSPTKRLDGESLMPEGGGANVEIAQHLSEHLGRKETPICQKIQVKKRLRSVKFH
jgi:hypothetical protein